ncbi:MAG: glycosyltransferase [Butyrivibrio sp.]|nr:glycosyltransferase [Butyrivibrio sp.]
MMQQVKGRIKKFLTSHMELNTLERFVTNINLDCTKKQKRVLVSYLDFFRAGRDVESTTVHTNRYELFQIINCFIKMDCVIDVCAHDDMDVLNIIDARQYDVVFGMGEVFRQAVKLNKNAYSILYLTENTYDVSFQREKERIDYLFERRGIKWEMYRTGKVFGKDDEKTADAVICMGETEYLDRIDGQVRRILPSAMINDRFSYNFSKKKKENFLVLGTAGFVHKGVDILVEVFEKHPEWQLFLCGHDIAEIMKKLGFDTPIANIHDCGYVDVKGEQFAKLVEQCVYILLPSCSEGFSTAIVTGMTHGMIPIICKNMGMDFMQQYCYFFESYKVEDVEKKLVQTLEIPMERLADKSGEIYKYAKGQFTLENFTGNLQGILAEILL